MARMRTRRAQAAAALSPRRAAPLRPRRWNPPPLSGALHAAAWATRIRKSLVAQTRNFIAHHKRPVVLSIPALFLAMGAYAVVKTVGHTGFLDFSALTGKDAPPARVAPGPAPARTIPDLLRYLPAETGDQQCLRR